MRRSQILQDVHALYLETLMPMMVRMGVLAAMMMISVMKMLVRTLSMIEVPRLLRMVAIVEVWMGTHMEIWSGVLVMMWTLGRMLL